MSFFKSLGHFFTTVAHDFVIGERAVTEYVNKVQPYAPVIEGATAIVYPPGVAVEKLAFHVLGEAAAAAHTMDDATGAKGLNLTLDAEVVLALKQLASDLKNFGKPQVQPALAK